MSLAEIKESVADMSSDDRLQLAAFLADLDSADEAAFREEVSRRMSDMDSGKKVTVEELERRHHRLQSEGR